MIDKSLMAVYDDFETNEDPKVEAEEKEEVVVEAKEPAIPPRKQQAIDDGWTDKDQWIEAGKDPDEWVDYKEFNFRGELMKTIQSKTKEIKKQTEMFDAALKEQAKITQKQVEAARKKAYDEALTTLKKQRREAMEIGDYEKVEVFEDEIDRIKEEHGSVRKQGQEDETSKGKEEESRVILGREPDWWKKFDDEIQRNYVANSEWYGKDQEITDYFDYQFIRELNTLAANNPEFDYDDLHKAVARVDKRINATFGSRFGSKKPPPVEGRSTPKSSGKKSKYSEADLSEAQLQVAKSFVRSGTHKNVQEYIDELAEIGAIGD